MQVNILRIGIALMSIPALASNAAAWAGDELTTHAVNDYAKVNGSAYCCSSCDELSKPTSDATKFVSGGLSSYAQQKPNSNGGVDGRDFTDPSQYSWGADDNDPYGTDFADVIFYSGHGGWSNSGKYAYIVMGDNNSGESCYPRIADDTASARHMEFGNTGENAEADAFVLFACNSVQHEVWDAGGYGSLSHSNGQFNIIAGFHGTVFEVSGYQTDLQNYSSDAQYNDIGDAWHDRMYAYRSAGSSNCPTTVVWGANSSERSDYYNYAGWFDFHNNGSRSGTTITYICSCDPEEGKKQPSC